MAASPCACDLDTITSYQKCDFFPSNPLGFQNTLKGVVLRRVLDMGFPHHYQ